jgi:hypothetical protein
MSIGKLINFEIFISTNKIFLKIQYFPSQIFLFVMLKWNYIISVEDAKVEGYQLKIKFIQLNVPRE